MGLISNLKDAVRRKRSRDFAKELSNQFFLSPICSDYENLFAQVRPLIDEMKMVVPYGIGRNGAKLPAIRTPELEWLKDPNDEMGWAEFADLMFSTWLTEDELDIHVWKDRRGKAVGYTVIPPQCRMYLGYGQWQWQVMTTEGLEVLTEEDVMRLRFSRSPRDVQRGVSPASAVRIWAQIDDLISQYQRAYFENGAIPATITFITASTKEKYEATRKELERNLKGARNRNKTVYAWRQFDNDSGESVDQVEVKTIQGNNSTLAIREIVDIINDRLNKAIGVSNFILGDDSSAKYDNAELSDHQFTKRRVYPALVSFWNQFQHELDRIVGGNGIGYDISFDLEIPELTEREKVKAEISRVRAEALVNLISAGASAEGACSALGLPHSWDKAASDIWQKGRADELLAPISVDYQLPKAQEATTDELSCSCGHTHDALPEMTADEKRAYDLLYDMTIALKEGQEPDVDKITAELADMLIKDAEDGSVDGALAIQLMADDAIAKEIEELIKGREIYVSEALKNRIKERTRQLVEGYEGYVQEVIAETLNNTAGLTANEISEQLSRALPFWKAEQIARNETLYAIRSGRLEQDEALAEKYGLNIKLVWRTSGDSKVCPVCAAMAGKTVDLGKAFPNEVILEDGEKAYWNQDSWNDNGRICSAHVNCVIGDTKVMADGVKAVSKTSYSGDIVKIKTAQGKALSVTPNHILLTERGWVAAKNLKKGDKVVAHSSSVKPLAHDDAVDWQIPTIADEFVAASKSLSVFSVKVPATAKDFKGDATEDEEIEVILPNGLLRNNINLSSDKLIEYIPFVTGEIGDSPLDGLSTLDQILTGTLLASNGVVGGSCESLALLGSKSGHADIHRFTSASAYNSRLEEAAANRTTVNAELIGNSFLANAGLIEFDDVIGIEIESVHNIPVYDIETTSTLYSANGLASSNCRCYWDEELV